MDRLSWWGMDPNETGYVFLCAWMIATGSAIALRSSAVRWAALAVSATLLVLMGLTASRGAFLAVIVFSILALSKTWWAMGRPWRLAAIGFACATVVVAGATGIWARSRPAAVMQDVSIGSRIDQWKAGARIMAATSHGVEKPEILVSQFYADEDVRLTFKPLASTTLTVLLKVDDWARIGILAGAALAVAMALAASDAWIVSSMSALAGLACAHTCNYLHKPVADVASVIVLALVAVAVAARFRSVNRIGVCVGGSLAVAIIAFYGAKLAVPAYPVHTDGAVIGSQEDGGADIGFIGYGRFVLGRFWGKEIRGMGRNGTSWAWTDSPFNERGRSVFTKWGAAVVFAHESRLNEPIFDDGRSSEIDLMLAALCADGKTVIMPNPSSLRHEIDKYASRITVAMGDRGNSVNLKEQYERRGYRCVVVHSSGSSDAITKDYVRLEDILSLGLASPKQ